MKNRKQLYSGKERRKFPRASARVIYAVVNNKQYLGNEVYTKNISIGGIGFISEDCIAKDEILSLDIVFPGGKSFVAQGSVLHVNPINADWSPKQKYEIGVEFINLTVIARQYIQDYLIRFISS